MNKSHKETVNLKSFSSIFDYGGSMVVAGEWIRKKAAEDESFRVISIDARGCSTDVYYRKRKNR